MILNDFMVGKTMILRSDRVVLACMFGDGGAMIYRVNEEVVEASTNNSPEERSDNWDPKVIILAREDAKAPSGESGEETRTQITSRVEGIPRLVAVRGANEGNGETDDKRLKTASSVVALIRGGENDN